MNKAEFARKRQLLWVYLRHQGKCAVCGHEVSPDDPAIAAAIPRALGIDELLQVRLTHSRCRTAAKGTRDREYLSAA